MPITQIILSRGGFGGSSNGQCLTNQFQFSSSFVPIPIAVAGSFSNWRVQTTAPGESISLTIEKNGSSTALALSYGASDTVASDSDSVSFAAGDTFEIQRTANPSTTAYSRIDWTPSDGESQLYAFTCPEFVSGRYIGVLNTTAGEENATENTVSSLVGVNGTVTAIRIAVSSDPGVGKSRVFNLVKNGVVQDGTGGTVDTTATNAAGTTTASASFSLPVVAGDTLSLKFTATGGATNPDMSGSIAFVGETATFMIGGAATESLSTTAGTSFCKPYPSNTDTSSGTEGDHEFIGADDLEINGIRVYLPTAPGSTDSRAFTLRKAASDTALTVTLTGSDQAAFLGGQSVTIGYADEWCVEETRTGSPEASVLKFVFTMGESLSSRNVFIGDGNAISGSDNFASGVGNTINGQNSQCHGEGGTVSANRSVLFNQDGGAFDLDEDDTVHIRGTLKVNGTEVSGGGGNSFTTISVSGQSDVVADSSSDTLTLVAGTNVTITTNAGTDTITIASTGGGGGINAFFPSFTTPVDGDFAWINQGGASVTVNGNGGIFLRAPTSGSLNQRIRKQAAPSVPYVITAAILPVGPESAVGLVFRQSSDGKLTLFFVNNDLKLYVQNYTNPTTFSSTVLGPLNHFAQAATWLRIADNNTNRICSVSSDGYNWITLSTVGRTSFLTADEVGFFSSAGATYEGGGTLLSWEET